MKVIQDKDFISIKKVLTRAYREKEKITIDTLWVKKVMAHIQDLSPYVQSDVYDVFYRITWRLVPVACVLIFLLGIAITQVDGMSDYELTKIFLEDPADITLMISNNS
jgi:hypothetical protein